MAETLPGADDERRARMGRANEQRRKRYADDGDYRAAALEADKQRRAGDPGKAKAASREAKRRRAAHRPLRPRRRPGRRGRLPGLTLGRVQTQERGLPDLAAPDL